MWSRINLWAAEKIKIARNNTIHMMYAAVKVISISGEMHTGELSVWHIYVNARSRIDWVLLIQGDLNRVYDSTFSSQFRR